MATKKKPAKAKTVKKATTAKTSAKKPSTKKAKPAVKKAKPAAKQAKSAAKKSARSTVKKTKESRGFPEKQLDAALKILDSRKAEDVVMIDLRGKSSLADYMLLATGRSSRQAIAMADYLRVEFEKMGVRNIKIEGMPQGDWVLLDTGDIVVHLFRPEVRAYYAIDDLWSGKRTARRKA